MRTGRKLIVRLLAVIGMISMLCTTLPHNIIAGTGYSLIVLSKYNKTMDVGEEFMLYAIASDGKTVRFSSDCSKVASVNRYGLVKAKKSGTALITAKTATGESSCKITVRKTEITVSSKSVSLENGQVYPLKVTSTTGHPVSYKSSKRSVATVDEAGLITALKPGETSVTVKVDDSTEMVRVKVLSPRVKISRTKVTLRRMEKLQLTAESTSRTKPKWKTNRKSVAVVDENGWVTAVKHGTAIITVTVDGVSKSCEIIVQSPTITFEQSELTMNAGETVSMAAQVSTGIRPVYSSSNENIVTIDANGRITAITKGKAYIYAKEDGAKARVHIIVK